MYIPLTHSETEDGLFNVASSVAVVPGLVAAICFQNADEIQMFGPASVQEYRGRTIHLENRAQNKSGVRSLRQFEKDGLQSWKPFDC